MIDRPKIEKWEAAKLTLETPDKYFLLQKNDESIVTIIT